jgi:hypothetical protein
MIPSLQFVSNGGSLACTTTFTDIPNLSFFVSAAGTYRFDAYVNYQGTATSTTVCVGMGGTCTATFLAYRCSVATSTNGGTSSFTYNVLAPTSGSATVGTISTNLPVVINGLIVVNAAGTLTVGAREGTVDATIQSGGRFTLEQLA